LGKSEEVGLVPGVAAGIPRADHGGDLPLDGGDLLNEMKCSLGIRIRRGLDCVLRLTIGDDGLRLREVVELPTGQLQAGDIQLPLYKDAQFCQDGDNGPEEVYSA
jgi:hypothetical protein